MNQYTKQYRQKLTTPEKAVELIRDGDHVVHGVTIAEPPALLGAIAARARAGDIGKVFIYSFNPQRHAAETYLAWTSRTASSPGPGFSAHRRATRGRGWCSSFPPTCTRFPNSCGRT